MRWQTADLSARGHAVTASNAGPTGSTPFRHLQEAQGAVFGRRMNWEQPFHYGDALAEHHAIRNHCGLIDSSSQSKLLIDGPDALQCVQRIFTANLNVPVGRGVFSCACNPAGGAIDDMVCWRLGRSRWLCIGSTAARWEIFRWIVAQIKRWGYAVTVIDQTDAYAFMALQGPAARIAMATLTAASLSNERFPFLSLRRLPICGVPMLVGRCGYSGELGFELYPPSQFSAWTWRHASQAVEMSGGQPCGIDALVSCGFEKGLTSLGPDYHSERSPVIGSIGFTVCLDKPHDFIGREVLQSQLVGGVDERVRGFVLEHFEHMASPGDAIYRGATKVGTVLWARRARTMRVSDGRCLVFMGVSMGQQIQVDSGTCTLTGRICSRYLYDPSHKRMRC